MTPIQVAALLALTLRHRYPVLLTGAPGVGKTSLVEQAADAEGLDVFTMYPALADPTDAKGLPWMQPGSKNAQFMPYDALAAVLDSQRPCAWVWDDFGQATPATQASLMPWLLARQNGDHRLPDHVTIVATTNGREHRAGVGGLLAPVKSRFKTIIGVEPDLDSWVQWALVNGVDPYIIAYVRQRPDMLCAAEVAPGLTNEHNPRTIANASDILTLGMPEPLLLPAMAGAVGEGWTVEFLAFRQMLQSMVSVDQILLNPTTAPLPEGPSQSYATVTGLAMKTTVQNFGRVGTYVQRMADAGLGEFAALCVKDATRKNPTLEATPDYLNLMSGALGRMILGQVS